MNDVVDSGTYEVLRARLAAAADGLAARAEELNARRQAVFGSAELRLIGTERIRTEHNCVPADIVSVGGRMLFGYNVFTGMKPGTGVDDVFSLHRPERDGDAFRFGAAGEGDGAGLLRDPGFERDFAELYRYYRDTRLLRLRHVDGRLLAVFQTGPAHTDIRVLRWRTGTDGPAEYLDGRGERDHVFPPSHDFTWTATTREDHVLGRHPHISVGGEVFVETVGGTLTVKAEDNTESGEGVYSEPVDEPLQALADADVLHARVGPLILLRVRPYNETAWRHLVFDTRTKEVTRLDGIGQACRRLPEDQGIVFPGGYYLATGGSRTFDTSTEGLEFERAVRSPNGEDVLYVFHARAEGRTLLLPYNVIRKEAAAPVQAHGYSLFDDGTMVVFQALSEESARVHPMQVWQTPFVSDTYAAAQPVGTGPLERVGNPDLVRGISDCLSVARTARETEPSSAVFEALIAACARAADHHHWLGDPELGDPGTPLAEVRRTAEQVLEEYASVRALTEQAAAEVAGSAGRVASLVRRLRGEAPRSADAWVRQLAELRREQGRLISLRDLRYADLDRIAALAAGLETDLEAAARRAVSHLAREDAFTGIAEEVDGLAADAAAIATVSESGPVGDRLDERAASLRTVTEVVGSLDIADATVRTGILERIAGVLAGVNRARAVLSGRRGELLAAEGRAGSAAEFALLGQAVTGALADASTPGACDEHLGRLLLQLEQLESRFGAVLEEDGGFLARLESKREEVYEAFSARKQALLDDRARRADRLAGSAARILDGVRRRAAALPGPDEVNTYFASDPVVTKVRAIADELRGLGDQIRAEELDGRLKSARQEAGRALRDRLDLYADGGETIRLGRHRFAVNTQPVDLALVPHGGRMAFALTGTDYRAPVGDEEFEATRPFWDQPLVSESPEVYRAEYLAARVLVSAGADALHEAAADGTLPDLVRRAAEEGYDEGHERGVHDHDAARILTALLGLHSGAGLLRYPPRARAAAQLYWAFGTDEAARTALTRRAASLGRARAAFGTVPAVEDLCAELDAAVSAYARESGAAAGAGMPPAAGSGRGADPVAGSGPGAGAPDGPGVFGEYLFEELAGPGGAGTGDGFVTSAAARALVEKFRHHVDGGGFEDDLRALGGDLTARRQLAEAWLGAFLAASGEEAGPGDLAEAVALALCPDLARRDSSAALTARVDGLLGAHPRITAGRLEVRIDELLERTRVFRARRVPAYRAYQRLRGELVERERRALRLEEFRPKVLGSFVRNRLLDEVYLPLIGDNLAKQLGAADDTKRTGNNGLLLLVSPPGYGKTTLMEYVADRLGLVLVTVSGPALGRAVTSLDPAEAPNATARREVERINFALEAGSNVLLYLDDIQHTSPELLQKFMSLCDAQRRMEGVRDGRTRTYELRGKRFAVCMAGNPYTESGQRFRVPGMLANRADVWNLGDVLSGRDELFALSYIENALTSNPVLAPLSTRDRADTELLVRIAGGDESVGRDRLRHRYSAVELDRVLSVLRKLLHVQRTVLTVNQAYIASAAQADASRTEPPFRLQGSYRNMNRLAERIVPVMNDAEVEAAVDDHYIGEAQTLTSEAEANLLKLAELRGRLTGGQAVRWAEVKAGYLRERESGRT